MTAAPKLFVLIFFIIVGSLAPVLTLGADLVDPGQITFRSPVSNMDFEQIDPYTGNLTLTHKDVALPGNGGLDLEIYRSYRTDRNVLSYSVFGLGWDLHFGRLRRSGDYISIELQDGTVNSAVKEHQDSAWSTYYTYLTKDFWKIDMEGTPTLQLPDGTEIVFGRGGTSAYENWYYATEIKKNNNTITIHYGTNRRVDYVMDSVGRRIDFHYSAISGYYRLTSITCAQDPEQRSLVTYSYPTTFGAYPSVLSKVTLPDGDSWRYDYTAFTLEGLTMHWLSSLATPYGGLVGYDYDSFKRADILGGYRFQLSVSEKTVFGSGLTAGTWEYDYGVSYEDPWGTPIHLDYTTITDSCGRETTYHFFGYSGGYDASGEQECYRYGMPKRQFTVDSTGQLEEAIEYTWDKLNNPLSPLGYMVTGACSDSATYIPVLLQQTIYHGGTIDGAYLATQDPDKWGVVNPANIYVTRFRDFDGYGNVQSIWEYDEFPPYESAPALKTTQKAYWYNEALNIVKDKPASVHIQGGSAFPGDFNISYDYDQHGNLLFEDRFGVQTFHTYHTNGNLESTKDANGNRTTFEWDNGAINETSNPIYTVQRSINWDGTMDSETNGREYTTSYLYTLGMRIKRITPPVGNPTIFNYHFGSDSYTQKTRGSFSIWTYFDGLGREEGTLDSIGKTTTISYKACGLKQYTTSNIDDTVYFDHLGRIWRITHKDGKYISYTNHSDTHIQITDEDGKVTHQYYDTFGTPGEKYLTRVVDAYNHTAYYGYNILGSLRSANFGGSTRIFRYNSKNFLYQEEHPESGITAYTYDGVGNVKSIDDGLATKFYSYDTINRPWYVIAGSQTLIYQHDNADNLTQLTSPYATVTYRYDPADRMLDATTTTLGRNGLLKFTYDGNDNLKTIRYPSGKLVNYNYNGLNQVTGISGFGGTVSEVKYITSNTGRGLMRSYRFGNGQKTTLYYNYRRAMTRTLAGALNLGFGYDSRGNMTVLKNHLDQTKNKTFSYNNVDRLKTFDGPWGAGRFDYYADGDRYRKVKGITTTSYGFSSNRMSAATGSTYSYNNDGDMTRAGSVYFDYTPFHWMWRVRANNSTLASFGYDANGNRVYKKVGSNTEIFLRGPDGNILADLDGSGRSKREYIYLNGKMVAKVGQPDRSGSVAPWLLLLLDEENN